ncbi:TerD family protein [Nocardia cyriacigeorgica]|uniref:TerD family protein n=1 Tax=Nocardia cyriacigeorgica TaxID=135487 RepID=A0ABX0CBU1_9NOCA|nr:TerD family protein [Nocardia cyriacigeorgica]NEW54055.1 TerD family protein [Nocardia cyriacigeorgica]
MRQLTAGQNVPLTAEVVRFGVHADAALDISALVVADDLRVSAADDVVTGTRTATTGVQLGEDGITVTLAEVRADAQAVLLVASMAGQPVELGKVVAELSESGTATIEFAIAPAAGERALICLEVYRRQGAWKVRAVGQGYAGGLAELLQAHGAAGFVPAAAASAAPHADPYAMAPPTPGGNPLEVGHGLERLWMIFEDAARSAAALISARDYAAKRLDQELSEAVSDPATRNTPAAETARVNAQRRHDELNATAEANHGRDSEQLVRELAEADQALPRSLASWESPAWDRAPVTSDGIRLGELYAIDRGALRIPYCVPVPLNRPLWIDTESSSAVAPVVGALLARLVAAAPQRRTVVDVIDLTGAFTGLTDLLAPVLGGPPITDHTEISARLKTLADAAELAEMAYNSGAGTPPAEHRVLVAADFPHGYQATDVQRLGSLLMRGDLIGLSTVIVGGNESDAEDAMVAALSQACRHLPTVAGTPLFDPWTGSAWELDLDLLPQEPERQARILRAH